MKIEIHMIISTRMNAVIDTMQYVEGPSKEDSTRVVESSNGNIVNNNKTSINNGSSVKEEEVEPEITLRGNVLLIDDSNVAAKVASKVLLGFKLEVDTANSATAGFDLLKKNPNKYMIIFLDVVMPKVDGVEALSWIKDDPETSNIPVNFISIFNCYYYC